MKRFCQMGRISFRRYLHLVSVLFVLSVGSTSAVATAQSSVLNGVDSLSTVIWPGSGSVHVFGVGNDHALFDEWWDGSKWNGTNLGGYFTSPPRAISWNGTVHIFLLGSHHELWHLYYSNSAWIWQNLGGTYTSTLSVTPWSDGSSLHVFGLGSNEDLWDGYLDSSYIWHPVWIGGTFTSPPVAIAWGGTVHVFGAGTNHDLNHFYWSGSSWVQQDLGGTIFSSLSVTPWSDNQSLHVFWLGTNNDLWDGYLDTSGTWHTDWIGGSLASPPAAIAWNGTVHVVGVDSGHDLWDAHYDTTLGWQWKNLGGTYTSPATLGLWTGSVSLHAFAIGQNADLWDNYFDGSSWRQTYLGGYGGKLASWPAMLPNLQNSGRPNIWYQREERLTTPDPLANTALMELYPSVERSEWNANTQTSGQSAIALDHYSVAQVPSPLKLQYILASVANDPNLMPDYPVKFTNINGTDTPFDVDELSFQHASDPANLVAVNGAGRIMLQWRSDGRTGANQVQHYNVYRSFDTSNPWYLKQWTKLASVPAQTGFAWYQDAESKIAQSSGGLPVCFMVTSVNSNSSAPTNLPSGLANESGETSYSFQLCPTYSPQTYIPYYFNYAAVTKLATPPPSNVIAKCPPLNPNRSDPTDVLNTYLIQVSFNQDPNAPPPNIYLHRYGFLNCATGQCTGVGDFQESPNKSCQMTYSAPPAGSTAASASMYYQDHFPQSSAYPSLPNQTEDLVAQIEIASPAGSNAASIYYPPNGNGSGNPSGVGNGYSNGSGYLIGSGYLTINKNNRIRDRIWGGFNMNPSNSTWQRQVIGFGANAQLNGYNAVFLDEFRPLKSVDYFGSQNEAPSIEFVYPSVQPTQYDPANDPWVGTQSSPGALYNLMAALRSALPGMKFFGNTLKTWGTGSPVEQASEQAAKLLDGGLLEGCFWDSSEMKPQVLGATWLSQVTLIQTLSAQGNVVVCLARAADIDTVQEKARFFNLGSYLLAASSLNSVYYAATEMAPTDWTETTGYPYPNINYFPEYSLDLGQPLGAAVIVPGAGQGAYFYQREFQGGFVVVNADTMDHSIDFTANNVAQLHVYQSASQLSSQVYFSSAAAQMNTQVPNVNPGSLTIDNAKRMGWFVVPAGTGAIFLK